MTDESDSELRVELEDWSGATAYANYSSFQVRDASTDYTLEVSGYTGNAGDSLAYHNTRPFLTYDRGSSGNCAETFKGAWWYLGCHASNLNGKYHHGNHTIPADGVTWLSWKGNHYSLKFTEMKVRAIG